MKNRMILALLLGMTAIFCSSQSFLSKYPKLTKKNLNEFFLDWEIYSDSIASNNDAIKDSVLVDVIRHEYAEFLRENCNNPNGVTPRYYVLPQSIEVGRYYSDMDTVMARLEFAFPLITDICYSNNLIAVMRRTSWWTGDVIWYVKENDKFVRRQQPVTTWVE